jgi:hypothetical protein
MVDTVRQRCETEFNDGTTDRPSLYHCGCARRKRIVRKLKEKRLKMIK